MKKFLIKIIIISLPIVLVLAFLFFILIKSGETTQIENAITKQNKTRGLIGYAYSNISSTLKTKKTSEIKPEVLILGTSRVMQFRDFFFNDSILMYNAGGGIEKIKEFKFFFDEVYENQNKSTPRLLIISLDQYFFNENWDNLSSNTYVLPDVSIKSVTPTILRQELSAILTGKITLSDISKLLSNNKNVGLTANIYNDGFREDGSYYYQRIINNNKDEHLNSFEKEITNIEKGTRRFEYSNKVNSKALDELSNFIEYCSKNHIHVVAFLPPYAHSIIEKMNQTGKYGYIEDLYKSISPIMNKYDFKLFDFTDIESFGSSDYEAIDGFHGSEKTYLRMFIEMSKNDSILNEFSKPTTELMELLKQSKNNFEVGTK